MSNWYAPLVFFVCFECVKQRNNVSLLMVLAEGNQVAKRIYAQQPLWSNH